MNYNYIIYTAPNVYYDTFLFDRTPNTETVRAVG